MSNELLRGRRQTGSVVTLSAAGAANAVALFIEPTGYQGTASFKIRKITYADYGTGGTFVHFGTGTGGTFADALTAIKTVSTQSDEIPEEQIPNVEFFANLTVYPEGVGASTIDVQVEVEVFV